MPKRTHLIQKGDSNSKHCSFFEFYFNISNKIPSTLPRPLNFQEFSMMFRWGRERVHWERNYLNFMRLEYDHHFRLPLRFEIFPALSYKTRKKKSPTKNFPITHNRNLFLLEIRIHYFLYREFLHRVFYTAPHPQGVGVGVGEENYD